MIENRDNFENQIECLKFRRRTTIFLVNKNEN